MAAGTSPAIAGLGNGSYEDAYQGADHGLYTGGWAPRAWALGMAPGTSLAITGLTGSNTQAYEAAFQANTGILWTAGYDGTSDTGYPMYPGSSPAIAGLTNGAYEGAFSEDFGGVPYLSLEGWTTDRDVIALDPSVITSPSITSKPPPAIP